MAHFAQLDSNNKVIQVIVVGNNDCLDSNGNESEEVGIAFCKSILGDNTEWVQTSYNSRIRGRFASPGDTYDKTLDIFQAPVRTSSPTVP